MGVIHDPALCIAQSIAGIRNECERGRQRAPVTIACSTLTGARFIRREGAAESHSDVMGRFAVSERLV